MTAKRMISGDVLKYRNGFFIRGRYETCFQRSSNFALTLPFAALPQVSSASAASACCVILLRAPLGLPFELPDCPGLNWVDLLGMCCPVFSLLIVRRRLGGYPLRTGEVQPCPPHNKAPGMTPLVVALTAFRMAATANTIGRLTE